MNIGKKIVRLIRRKSVQRAVVFGMVFAAASATAVDLYQFWKLQDTVDAIEAKRTYEKSVREKYWKRVEENGSWQFYRDFIAHYHNGPQVDIARQKLQEIAKASGQPIFVLHRPSTIGERYQYGQEFRSNVSAEVIGGTDPGYKLGVRFSHPNAELSVLYPQKQTVGMDDAFWGFTALAKSPGVMEITAVLEDYSENEVFPRVIGHSRVWIEMKPTLWSRIRSLDWEIILAVFGLSGSLIAWLTRNVWHRRRS